jgi:hypothetical protein
MKDAKPTIPLGTKFWPLMAAERAEIKSLFKQDRVRPLVRILRFGNSLGKLRFAVLLGVGNKKRSFV